MGQPDLGVYTRIRGALGVLGHLVGRNTIARILADAGLDPSPNRPTRWRDFLRSHLGHVFAADFFTVEVLTFAGLVRYHVLFVIDRRARSRSPAWCTGRTRPGCSRSRAA